MGPLLPTRRASGLIVALAILALLSLMATTFVALVRLDARVTTNYVDDLRCEVLAHGMLSYFKALLRDDHDRTWGKYENRDTSVGQYDWHRAHDATAPHGGGFVPSVSARIPGLYSRQRGRRVD